MLPQVTEDADLSGGAERGADEVETQTRSAEGEERERESRGIDWNFIACITRATIGQRLSQTPTLVQLGAVKTTINITALHYGCVLKLSCPVPTGPSQMVGL